jgi:hypothetical protein
VSFKLRCGPVLCIFDSPVLRTASQKNLAKYQSIGAAPGYFMALTGIAGATLIADLTDVGKTLTDFTLYSTALHDATQCAPSQFVIVSDDQDFLPLVSKLKHLGHYVVSASHTQPAAGSASFVANVVGQVAHSWIRLRSRRTATADVGGAYVAATASSSRRVSSTGGGFS